MKKLRVNVPYQIISTFGDSPCGDNGVSEVIYHCPYCEERHGSPDLKGKLYVNTKTLKYICFRCGASGQIGRKIEYNSSKVYGEDISKETEDLLKDINDIISSENSIFNLRIPSHKIFESRSAVDYMIGRGFTVDQMKHYDLRVGDTGSQFGRIVVPNQVFNNIYTDYFSARSFIGQEPKYKNPRKYKSSVVFNLFRIKKGSPIILVEGALTAIAAGYNAVASLGKTLTLEQASQIACKKPSVVYVNYDYGAEEYTERACRLLRKVLPCTEIRQVFMKDDRDAADLSYQEYVKCLENYIEYDPFKESLKVILSK